ncbi:MAG: metal-dependent hydrolase [Cyanobacteria bacterium P01_F01_bin.150]
MSSFIGHGLMAVAFMPQNIRGFSNRWQCYGWSLWLIVVAWGADVDYILPPVHPSSHNGLRITHSLVVSFFLTFLTSLWLWKFRRSWLSTHTPNKLLYLQVLVVSISHLILDVLVGVTPLPLLYPFSVDTFRLPFGILPSAGKLDVMNHFFWRNLYLELGVLLPFLSALLIFPWNPSTSELGIAPKMLTLFKWGGIVSCMTIAAAFIHECHKLPRP